MRYELFENPKCTGQWIAQAIGTDGEIYTTTFDYHDAKSRAEEYAAWMNSKPAAHSHAFFSSNN